MPNPPLHRVETDLVARTHTVFYDTGAYVFPLVPGAGAMPAPADSTATIVALRADLDTRMDAGDKAAAAHKLDMDTRLDNLLAAIKAIPSTPPVVTPPVVTPPVVTPPAAGMPQPVAGVPVFVLAEPYSGIYSGLTEAANFWYSGGGIPTIHFVEGVMAGGKRADVPMNIVGAGMRKTIFNGGLAWGKGVLLVGGEGFDSSLSDCGFTGGINHADQSDGSAGVYVAPGNTEVSTWFTRVSFDGNCDGVYSPFRIYPAVAGIGSNTHLMFDRCVWGRTAHNGLSDGLSHDVYLSSLSAEFDGCIFVGNSWGNTIKVRTPVVTVKNSWIGGCNGRWIDNPSGAVITSSGNTYVRTDSTQKRADAPTSNNCFGFFDENDTGSAAGPGSFTSSDDTFIFDRQPVIWINHADFTVKFSNATVKWIGAAGSVPPVVTIQGPGVITGVNPFAPGCFTEANRLDAAPLAPADPA